MDTTTIDILRECAEGSMAGRLTFPQVVGKLAALDIETYHTDLNRQEHTYYAKSGESHVVPMDGSTAPIAAEFSDQGVAAAVRDSQQGKQTYSVFLDRIRAAGTTQYFVYIAGRRAVYIGRDGSEHVELFPSAM